MENMKNFRKGATIGIHEDGTKEVLAFGKSFDDDPEGKARAAKYYGCTDIYHVLPEKMTAEECEMVRTAFQELCDRLSQWVK